jgi:hypothetical protein
MIKAGFTSVLWFMGYVEDNNDPISGRVRVRAFGIHPTFESGLVQTEDLPWAHVLRQGKFTSTPDVGDTVVGFFMDGREAQNPVIVGIISSAKYSLPSSMISPTFSSFGGEANGTGAGPTNRSRYAYDFFIKKGFTPEQAAGIVGNLQAESGSNLDNLFNPNDKGLPSYGIAQWRGSRADAFRNLNGVYPNEGSLDQQLEFILYELNTTEGRANEALRASTSAAEAAEVFDKLYERSDGSTIQTRINNAQTLLDSFYVGESLPSELSNPYLAPSQDVVQNFGNPALPPQISGEGLQFTPVALQSTMRIETSPTMTSYSVVEPSVPINPNPAQSSVWASRHGGVAITISGKSTATEFIDITHPSGTRITLDGNGNIAIKSLGKVFIGSENEIEEVSNGHKMSQHLGGYALVVEGGTCQILSAGNIDIVSGGNITLNAAGKLIANSGDTVDIAGSAVSVTSKVDGINVLSGTNISLESSSGNTNIKSAAELNIGGEAVSVSSSGNLGLDGGTIGLSSDGAIAAAGSQIHLNSTVSPEAVTKPSGAAGATVPETPELKSTRSQTFDFSPSDIGPTNIDDGADLI